MKRICVYCGARAGNRAEYASAAEALGRELAQRGIGLVYGGGSRGLMGRVAGGAAAHGGETLGIIPKSLFEREGADSMLGELRVVENMHERKALMASLADGFIALPGGLGTLEELFEMLAWEQLGFHNKPCALLNSCGYYDNLSEMLRHSVDEGFLKGEPNSLMIVENEPARLLDRMLGEARA